MWASTEFYDKFLCEPQLNFIAQYLSIYCVHGVNKYAAMLTGHCMCNLPDALIYACIMNFRNQFLTSWSSISRMHVLLVNIGAREIKDCGHNSHLHSSVPVATWVSQTEHSLVEKGFHGRLLGQFNTP